MRSIFDVPAELGKRFNLLLPLSATGVIAALQRRAGARRPVTAPPEPPDRPAAPADSPVVPGQPVGLGTAPHPRPTLYYVLVNVGVVLLLCGFVPVVSAVLFAIPVPAFVAVFTAACLILVLTGVYVTGHRSATAGRILCGWAAVAFGLVVFAGAQLAGLTGFVPDLVLVWLAGVLALGLWVRSSGLLTAAAVTVIVWVSLAYLYDRSYLPAVAALIGLHWFALRRPASGALTATLTLATVTVAVAYFHNILHPAHYPLALATGELLVAVAVVGALGALWAVAATVSSPAEVRPVVLAASRRTVRALGYILLATVALHPAWVRLRHGFEQGGTAVLTGAALLALTATLVLNMPMAARDRIRFLGWAARFALLTAALYAVPPGFGPAAPLLAALALAIIGYRQAARGAASGEARRLLAGGLLLVVVVAVTLAGWRPPLAVVTPVFVVLGLVALKVAHDWQAGPGEASAENE